MDFQRLAEILEQAAKQGSPSELEAFLDAACRDQPELRNHVESLLAMRDKAGDFLEATVSAAPPRMPHENLGDWIGRYKLLQKLGEGGCGVVYMAEQREPVHRRVALKVIKLGMDTLSVVTRFEAERQALARMEHPGVAQVFDAGVTEAGRPFFVMELVRGVRITEYCDSAKLPICARLELFVKVCNAIQHAHQKGVIHRDIKPANILVTVNDGIPVPKVIDFGIAKAVEGRLTDKTLFTAYEQFLGTPAYMSPEQAAMTSLDVDTRSDIYSLGVLLYELLTGSTPFDTKELMALGLDEMRRTIREKDPIRPSTRIRQSDLASAPALHPRKLRATPLSADLDWIVMKCLEKDRARRYETANGLAMDISRHLANEPVLARPPSTTYRLQKAFRRNRSFFLASGVVLLALLGGIVVSVGQARLARRESRRASAAELATAREAQIANEQRDRALAAQTEADRSAGIARRYAYVATLSLAARAWLDGNLARVRQLLQSQAPQPGKEDLRDFEWRYLWKHSRDEAITTLTLPRIPTWDAVLTPDGTKLITAQLYDCVRVFHSVQFQPMATLSTNVIDIDLSGDGRTLAVLRLRPDQVEIYDVDSLQMRLTIAPVPPTADQLVVAPDGSWMAAADASQITLWETQDGRQIDSIPIRARKMGISAFNASSDRSTFVTSDDRSLFLWDRASRALLQELPGHAGGAYSAVFSRDGRWLATGGWLDRCIRVWEGDPKRLVTVFTNHNGWIGHMDFSPDGSTLAFGGSDHTLRLWDLKERKQSALFRGQSDEIWHVLYSHDGRLLISGNRAGEVSYWNPSPPQPEVIHLKGDFLTGTFSSDSRHFTTLNPQGTIQTWDAAGLREIGSLSVPVTHAVNARFAPGCSVLAVGMADGKVQLYDWAKSRPMPTLDQGEGQRIRSLEFSADGQRLASATDLELRVWDCATGTSLYRAANPEDAFWADYMFLTQVALSPNGNLLAFGTAHLELRLVNLTTRVELTLTPDLWGVGALAFSPDGQHLAATGRDHRIKIWKTSNWEEITTLRSWRQGAHCIAFHPSSKRLAVGIGEMGIQLVDLASMQEVVSFPADDAPRTLQFSPDGQAMVGRFGFGFQFWRAPSWETIAAAESKTGTRPNRP